MAKNFIENEKDGIVSILGSEWTIEFVGHEDDPAFEEDACYGYADDCERKIKLCIPYEVEDDSLAIGIPAQRLNLKRVLRHELVHAFLSESGLADSAIGTGDKSWATNEEMVDWFARMSPKIFKIYSELEIL